MANLFPMVILQTAGFRHNREFYARPNRLQKSVWPPPEFDTKRLPSVKEGGNNENMKLTTDTGTIDTDKHQQRLFGYADGGGLNATMQPAQSSSGDNVMPLQPKSTNTLPPHRLANHLAREQFYNNSSAKEIVVVPQLHANMQGGAPNQQAAMDADDSW